MVRLYELEDDDPYVKKIGAPCLKRDRILGSLVKQHKDGEITTDQYFEAIVKANRDYDLPGAAQAALEAVEEN